MKRLEFQQELMLRSAVSMIDRMVFIGAKNYMEYDEGAPIGLNSVGKSMVEDRYDMVRHAVDELDSRMFFDDSEPVLKKDPMTITPETSIGHALELSRRTLNALRGGGIKTVGDLLKVSKTDLLKMRNFGLVSLTNVNDFLEKYGFETK